MSEVHDWSPFHPKVMEDPANGHSQLLDRCPVHHCTSFEPPFYTLSRYADVEAALRDIDTFSSHFGQGPRFTDPLGMLADPTDPDGDNWDWSAVGLVEVFVLIRSLDADPNYADEKTYDMLGLDYTPTDDAPDSPADPHPQEYARLLVCTPVMLRNRLLYIRGGQ